MATVAVNDAFAGPSVAPNTWTQLSAAADSTATGDTTGNCNGRPCGRAWFPMAYDISRDRTIMYGGGNGGGCGAGYINDLWELFWNGTSYQWNQRLPVNRGGGWPQGQDNHSMAYDQINRVMWIGFGTCGGGFGYYDYDLNRFVSIDYGSETHGSDRSVYDPGFAWGANKIVVVSGEPAGYDVPGGATSVYDTSGSPSSWNTNDWSLLRSCDNPLQSSGCEPAGAHPYGRQQIENVMVWMESVQRFMLFGGYLNPCPSCVPSTSGAGVYNDTWEYDPATNIWTKINPSTKPPGRQMHVQVWNSKHNVVMLHGGQGTSSSNVFSDTWIYNPATKNWTQLAVSNTPARTLHAGVYDRVQDVMLLWGGTENYSEDNEELFALQYVPSGSGGAECGNGVVESGETCDGVNLSGQSCASMLGAGFTGSLTCNSTCTGFNTNSCIAPSGATCGNGVLETGEVCDGSSLGGATCSTVLGSGWTGSVACNSSCNGYTTTSCTPQSGGLAYQGDCSGEELTGRTDVLLCEPWQQTDWWDRADYVDASRNDICQPGSSGCSDSGLRSNPLDSSSPLVPTAIGYTEIVSQLASGVPCVSGNCMKVHFPTGSSGKLSLKWLTSSADSSKPERMYMRYYLYLSPNWDTRGCSGGQSADGGKFPGLSDERIPSDPSGQCGNGGGASDGINCWSSRLNFQGCTTGGHTSCANSGKPNATTRIGTYMYFPGQNISGGSNTGLPGHFDDYYWHQFSAGGGSCDTVATNTYCGIGNAGMLENGRWYLVEFYVQMNTVGSANGIVRGWVDGVLSYDKSNMVFRLPGHDDLHVRTVWLDAFNGGPYGSCNNKWIGLDQLVVARDGQIGAFGDGGPVVDPPATPFGLTLD